MTFKKYIAFEVNIPDEYIDKEDAFMEQLLDKLGRSQEVASFDLPGGYKLFTLSRIFTGKFEFVDPIKGF